MKVLYILSQKPGNTGSGVYLNYITKEALKRNIDIRIIVGITHESDLDILSHIPKDNIYPVVFGKDTDFPIAGMSDVMPYKSIKFSEFTDEMYKKYCKAFLNTFKRVANNWKPDIVHSNHLWIATAMAVKFFKDTPVIASCHGTALRQRILAPAISEKNVGYLKNLDKILALTKNQKNEIIEWLNIENEKVFVTGNGYANDIFCMTDNKKFKQRDLFKIVYAGKVSYSKGVPYLVEAFKRLNSKIREKSVLYIVGDYNNNEAKEIIKLAKGIENIIFFGKLDQVKLSEKFKESHLFILPSFFEGLPLVVIESLACGCAAIVTRLPDIENWIDSNLIDNDVIRFLPMPRLKSVDEPEDSEIGSFINNLKVSIEDYAEMFFKRNFPNTEKFIKYITEHSFENLFNKILTIYNRLIQ